MARRNSNPYLARLFRAKHLQRLVGLSLWPNDKEYTESAACLAAVTRYCPYTPDDRGVTALVVGDGRTPRTGALIAASTAWQVLSVDPVLRKMGPHPRIERLTMYKERAETLAARLTWGLKVVIVACHSHAPLHIVHAHINAGTSPVISLPCCVKDKLGDPRITYSDPACLSPCCTINVY